jgi:hypothetical protein
MIADFSTTVYYKKLKEWKYCTLAASVGLAMVAYFTIHGPYTKGKPVDDYLRRLVLNNSGDHGASIDFWQSNPTTLLLCTGMMVYVELVPIIQTIFGWFPFVYLG